MKEHHYFFLIITVIFILFGTILISYQITSLIDDKNCEKICEKEGNYVFTISCKRCECISEYGEIKSELNSLSIEKWWC